MPEWEEQVSGVLEQITKRSSQPSLGLSYLSLPRLLFKLRTAQCETEEEVMAACPSENIALSELEKKRFLYSGGLGCDHHEQADAGKCCQTLLASGIFTLLDICCPAFNIEMLPGSHAPNQTALIKPVTWKDNTKRRSGGGGMAPTVTADGIFASQDVRYKEESSASSISSSGSSYQRYVDSAESASTVEYSDQNSDKVADEKNSDKEADEK